MSQEIFENLLKNETKYLIDSHYLDKQSDIDAKSRKVLVYWMMDLSQSLKLTVNILTHGVSILDKYIEKKADTQLLKDYKLVGIMSLRLACTYDGWDTMTFDDVQSECDYMFTTRQIREMEMTILKTIDFNISYPTAFSFMDILLYEDCKKNSSLNKVARYLLVETLKYYKFLEYKPSIVASSIVYISKKHLKITPYWSPTLRKMTKYSTRKDMKLCIKDIMSIESLNFETLLSKLKISSQ